MIVACPSMDLAPWEDKLHPHIVLSLVSHVFKDLPCPKGAAL